MKILVTGGAGFIGCHTVDLLLTKGYEVCILDGILPPVHMHGHIPDYVPLKHVEFIQGDVRNKFIWEQALKGVEAVYHLAAYQDYLPDFSTFFHTNTVSTSLLYEVIVEKRLPIRKVIIASSQAVYGEGKYCCENCSSASRHTLGKMQFVYPMPRSESQLKRGNWELVCPVCQEYMKPQWTDESNVHPHNQYAISKYSQELVALGLGQRYTIPTICMRYSIVQGSRQSFRNAYSGIARIFTQLLLTGKAPICYEDGQQIRDYVSVKDVAWANLLVLENEHANFQALNVGGDRKVTVQEYASLIARYLGLEVEPQIPGLYRFGDARHIFSDISKLRNWGWQPTVSLEEIIDEYIDWVQKQPNFRDHYTDAEQKMKSLGILRRAHNIRSVV